MSATRDKTQKITFVYSNLYSIYRKGVAHALAAKDVARAGATQASSAQSPSASAEALTELAFGPTGAAGLRTRAQAFESGVVIKSASARPAAVPPPAPRVTPYTPAELLGKRIARPAVLPTAAAKAQAAPAPVNPPEALESLKQNLQSLNDLQARLRFMLKELEDLIKE